MYLLLRLILWYIWAREPFSVLFGYFLINSPEFVETSYLMKQGNIFIIMIR